MNEKYYRMIDTFRKVINLHNIFNLVLKIFEIHSKNLPKTKINPVKKMFRKWKEL